MLRANIASVVSNFLVFFLLAASPVNAQTAPPPERGRTIFDYKKDLNLSDRQEQDIKNILEDLNKEIRVTRAKATLIDVEIGDLIKKEGDLEQIRKRLRELYDLEIALKMADIVAGRKINGTLSPEQLKRWKAIQAEAARAPR
jgi:NH3-dependent NAD+ synthetase